MTNVQSLWTSKEVTDLTGGKSSTVWDADGVSIDSRTIEPGDLFIPISGPNFDGHNFIASALNKGAAASITSGSIEEFPEGSHLMKVADTIDALNKLGNGARNRSMAKVIAVTGSVGKTGVKEALGRLLSEQGNTSFSFGSYNNHFGVPLSLARLPKNAEFGVFELGMNHSGELNELSQMVRPDVAVITTVDIAHTEFFSSIDDLAKAKAEIFAGLHEGGTAILNRDNQYYNFLNSAALSAGAGRVIGFGLHDKAQFKLVESSLNPEGSLVKAHFDNTDITYQLSTPGQHWVQNSLAVLASVHAVGADVISAARSFAKIKPYKGRGQLHTIPIQGGHFYLIDDSYNACPASVTAAISVLAGLEPMVSGRRICVFGDMKELGDKSIEHHYSLANKIRESMVDIIFTVGPEMKQMCDRLPSTINKEHADRAETIIQPLLDIIRPGDIILVKGSASHKLSKVVDRVLDMKVDLNCGLGVTKEDSHVI